MRAWGIYTSSAGADSPLSQVTHRADHVSDSLLEIWQLNWKTTVMTSSSVLNRERERALIKAQRIYILQQGGSVRGLSQPMLPPTMLGCRQKNNPVDKECWPRTTSWFHKKAQHPHVKASRPFSSKCWSCVIYKSRNDRSLWSGYVPWWVVHR